MPTPNNISEIVPVSVIMNIAKRIRTLAASIGQAKNVPRLDARNIGIPEPKITQHQIQINLTLSRLHSAYEWGSGIHDKNGAHFIDIYPVRAKALAFEGTHAYEGQTIVTQHVSHPGVAARPFLQPAKEQTRQQNLQDIRDAAHKNIRLIVVGMSRKV